MLGLWFVSEMDGWFIFAILGAVFWSGNAIFDKFVLTNRMQNAYIYNIYTMVLDIPFILIFLFIPISFGMTGVFLGVITGFILSFSNFAYNKVMMKEEASVVTLLLYTKPIFVILIAWLLLSESLTAPKYLGILLLLASSLLISYAKPKKKLFLYSIVSLVLLISFMWAIGNVISKYALFSIDYWSLLFWTLVGQLITVPIWFLHPAVRNNFVKISKSVDKKIYAYITANEVIYNLGELSFFIAASLGFVSVVTAITGLVPFFVLLFALIISVFSPKILREVLDKKTITLKLIAVILIFVGGWLVTL
jgi:drug/metabolite transporter (DMT)-like permease